MTRLDSTVWKITSAPWDLDAVIRGQGTYLSLAARRAVWRGERSLPEYPSAGWHLEVDHYGGFPFLNFHPSIDLDKNVVARLLREAVSVLRYIAPSRCEKGVARWDFKRNPAHVPDPDDTLEPYRRQTFEDWYETSILAGFEPADISHRERHGIKFEEHTLVLPPDRLPEPLAPIEWEEDLAEAQKTVSGEASAINAHLQRIAFGPALTKN